MAVLPASAPVLALTPPFSETEVANLRRALETERSAGRALVAAIAELESRAAANDAEVARTRHENTAFAARVLELETVLAMEMGKPGWRRLLNR